MMKKTALLLSALSLCCLFGGCGEKKPNEPGGGAPVLPEEPFDAEELPFYVKDIEHLEYTYTEEERLRPYWMGNVIYNEQLMVVEQDGKTQGNLLYEPIRVLSVRDWTLKKEYREGADYVFSGTTITLPEGSSIPVFRDGWSRGEGVPAAYPEGNAGTGYQMIGDDNSVMYTETGLIYQHYIHVTYVYDPKDVNRENLKSYDEELYGLTQKIKNREEISMAVIGDSISEGHSSSECWNHEPFCPPYAKLVKRGIELYGGVEVEYTNLSVGGKASDWGADPVQLGQISKLAPDLLIVAFGTNDRMDHLAGETYRANIEEIIASAKAGNSECQILLVAPFPSHEKMKSAQGHRLICENLRAIVRETAYLDIGFVSMYEGCLDMLNVKKYYEIAGNNANHPNDFIHRFYAMNILSAIFDFQAFA